LTLSFWLCPKNKRNNFSTKSLPYNPAVRLSEGKDTRHADSCPFFQQLIRASYKFPRENVFVSSLAFMHIGLLLTNRKAKASKAGCNGREIFDR
jgi:hypothetical protein